MNKKIYITLLQGFLIITSICMFFYWFVIYTSVNEQVNLDSHGYDREKYIKITDNYDTKGHKTFIEFISEDDSLNKMKSFYQDIIDKVDNRYLEMSNQDIYFIGKYSNGLEFVSDEDHELVNQQIKNMMNEEVYVTPLQSIQLSKDSFEQLNLNVSTGEYFTDNDYKVEEDTIYIILGDKYKNIYKIGDEIKGSFLNKEFTFKVKGFLSDNSVIPINDSNYDLSNCIIMPLIELNYEIIDQNDLDFQKIIYSIKSTGYIRYSSNENYTVTKNTIEDLIEKSGLDYICIDNDLQEFTEDSAAESLKNSRLMLIFSAAIIIILSCIITFSTKRFINKNLEVYNSNFLNKSILSEIKFKIFSVLSIQWVLGIVCSIYFSFNCFKDTVYFLYFIRSINKQLIIFIIILIFIISYLNIFLNKINIRLEKCREI